MRLDIIITADREREGTREDGRKGDLHNPYSKPEKNRDPETLHLKKMSLCASD